MVAEKSADAFRTISEVADDLQVPQHVLRFWEGRFPQIKPLKRAGGRRYYRPEDVALLTVIKDLLYKQGLTIKGVQAALKDGTVRDDPSDVDETDSDAPNEEIVVVPHPHVSTADHADLLPLVQPSLPGLAPAPAAPSGFPPQTRRELAEILNELEQLRYLLRPND